MKIAFIGDIIGRPGREMLAKKLLHVRKEYGIDFVIANSENVSHGFGMIRKNADELLKAGVDFMTGGNHTWDKKEIISMFEDMPLIRPLNYPDGVPGSGYKVVEVCGEKLAIINVLGHYGMSMVENPFIATTRCVESLIEEGIKNIIIDFHAESTAEKRGLYMMLQGKISALFGTHTHIGTDDLSVELGTCYVSDVGLSGCRDNVIGMDKNAPIKRMMTGLPASFDIPKQCKKIMQLIVCEIIDGKCISAQKLRVFDDRETLVQEALYE